MQAETWRKNEEHGALGVTSSLDAMSAALRAHTEQQQVRDAKAAAAVESVETLSASLTMQAESLASQAILLARLTKAVEILAQDVELQRDERAQAEARNHIKFVQVLTSYLSPRYLVTSLLPLPRYLVASFTSLPRY